MSFGLDGTSYEIDLNDKNASKLRDALAPYVGHARKVWAVVAGPARPPLPRASGRAREVRDWARSNGYEVSDRGRVSADVSRRTTPPTEPHLDDARTTQVAGRRRRVATTCSL